MIHNIAGNASAIRAPETRSGSLGNNTKSSPPPDDKINRTERYRLLSKAREILYSAGREAGLVYPANYHKTAKCIHTRFGDTVQVYKSIEHKKAFYGGVMVCGKVFTCPVCAAKVQERRRLEIAQAFDWAYENGKKVILVTITFPHQRNQSLSSLLKMQSKALMHFRKGSQWDKKKQRVGFDGMIRSLEVTHGESNGWHPHTHEAWIVNPDVDTEKFREWLVNRWFNVCLKAGLIDADYKKIDHFYKHSIQITDFASNSDYLAKMDSHKYWGADAELAKSSVKQAKGKGRHPFELLNLADQGDYRSSKLFLEYAEGMRGKAQIFWSRGLKDRVLVEDLTDEEIAQKKEDNADLLGHLSSDDWRFITRQKAQGFVLDLAETSGLLGVRTWLATEQQILVTVPQADTTPMFESENKAKAKRLDQIKKLNLKRIKVYTPVWNINYSDPFSVRVYRESYIPRRLDSYNYLDFRVPILL